MASGDGLLLRVRPRRGRLSVAQLQGLAAAAAAHGNGIIELTRRASLQVRGVTSASLPDLQAELSRIELAEPSLAAEQRPSLLVCPLAGLEPRSASLEPLAAALELLLRTPLLVEGLSEKFLVVLSGGSDVFAGIEADLFIELSPAAPDLAQLSLAGGSPGPTLLGTCRVREVAGALRQLLGLLGATPGTGKRMRELVAARGVIALRAQLAPLWLEAEGPVQFGADLDPVWIDDASRFTRFSVPPLGYHAGLRDWFAFQLAFGSAPAQAWHAIAELAQDFGSGEARLLPGRCVLLPGVRAADREPLARRAREQHFIVERPAPWLELVACSGAPACRSASAETRALALELAPLARAQLQRGATLHVSGCEKGCAWGGAADITLLHGPDGYKLGFDADVAQTARSAALSLSAVRERLACRSEPRSSEPRSSEPRSSEPRGSEHEAG
ncbi:MAG: precorrin-3B synthase [Pseudomonadota bacterium]|jgi:precorrin-3B synthase